MSRTPLSVRHVRGEQRDTESRFMPTAWIRGGPRDPESRFMPNRLDPRWATRPGVAIYAHRPDND